MIDSKLTPRPSWLVPLACLVATGTLLGLSTILAKVAGGLGVSPLAYLVWSLAGAGTVLAGFNARAGRLAALVKRRYLAYFIIAALVSVSLPNLIFFSAVTHVGASFVALAIAFPPLYTYLAAVLLGLERFDSQRALGVALALAGVLLLAVLKFQVRDAPVGWILATLFAPMLLAVGNIYRSLSWPAGARPDELAPGMLLAGALLLLPAAVCPGSTLTVPYGDWRPPALVLLQIASFAVQYQLFFILQKTSGPVFLSLLGSVSAITGLPLAVVVLGELPPVGIAQATILIALGIALLTFRSKTS